MKVITEDRLRELLEENIGSPCIRFFLKNVINSECQELDQLTVTKLRPMSDVPRSGHEFLVKIRSHSDLTSCRYHKVLGCFVTIDYAQKVSEMSLEGWLPLPKIRTGAIMINASRIPASQVSNGFSTQDIKANSGGSVSYYKVTIDKPTTLPEPYEAECNDIIEALGMNFAEGNIFKALWRRAAARRGVRKGGYDHGKYDAEKILFFAQRLIVMEKGD